MKPILIVSDSCPKCEMIKKYIKDRKLESDIDIIDASDPEGMAQVAFMELVEKTVPLLVFPTVIKDVPSIIARLDKIV